MKKIIILVLIMFTIVGCSCKDKTVKIKVDDVEMPGVINSSNYLYQKAQLLSYELSSIEKYDEKITNKDSFLLFVYRNGCAGCDLLAPALKEYVDENNAVIYTIGVELITSSHDLYKEGINTTPYLVLIEEGKIAYKEVVTKLSYDDEAGNIEWVKKWMTKHVEWGK